MVSKSFQYFSFAFYWNHLLTWTLAKSTLLRSVNIWLICEVFWRTALAAWAKWLSEVYRRRVWAKALTALTYWWKKKRIIRGRQLSFTLHLHSITWLTDSFYFKMYSVIIMHILLLFSPFPLGLLSWHLSTNFLNFWQNFLWLV